MGSGDTSERDRYQEAQAAVLEHYGTEATSRFVQLDDPPLRVHVLEAGRGEPVVLLHGGGGMAAQMEPLLGRLADRYRVLVPDRPGCGLTDPFDYRGVDFRQHGVRFLEGLWDVFELGRASLVAGSIAGLWALAFGLDQPERLHRIALVGSPAGLSTKVPVHLRIMSIPLLGDLLFATVMRPSRANVRRQFDEFVVHADRVPEELLEATHLATSLPGAHNAFRTMVQGLITLRGFKRDSVVLEDLPALELPVLFVWGARDGVYPPTVGEDACHRLRDGRLEVVPDAGHFVWLDAPDRTHELLRTFLG